MQGLYTVSGNRRCEGAETDEIRSAFSRGVYSGFRISSPSAIPWPKPKASSNFRANEKPLPAQVMAVRLQYRGTFLHTDRADTAKRSQRLGNEAVGKGSSGVPEAGFIFCPRSGRTPKA